MKRLNQGLGFWRTALVTAVGWSVASLLVAGTLTIADEKGATDETMMKEKTMTAEVVMVDVPTSRLTVKRLDAEIHEPMPSHEMMAEKAGVRGDELTLVVDEDTRITDAGGVLATLASLKPGDRVNIRYEMMEDGPSHALGVEKSSSKKQ